MAISTPTQPGQSPASATVADLHVESARVKALASRIKVLNTQLDQVRSELNNVDAAEPALLELQRRKELQETNYRYLATSLEQSRIDEALGAGKVSNISRIQEPSPAFRSPSNRLKTAMMILFGSLGTGLAWAFAT